MQNLHQVFMLLSFLLCLILMQSGKLALFVLVISFLETKVIFAKLLMLFDYVLSIFILNTLKKITIYICIILSNPKKKAKLVILLNVKLSNK